MSQRAPFYHVDHRAIDRVNVRDFVGACMTQIIRLDNIRSLRIISLDKVPIDRDFNDADDKLESRRVGWISSAADS